MLSFYFAGKNSYDDYGIKIASRAVIPSPSRKVNYVDVPGRDSRLRFDEGTFNDITIAVECSFLSKQNLAWKVDEVKAWLLLAGENDLIFSFQNTRKYKAQVVNRIDFSQTLKYISKFVIIFNCKPFKYAVSNSIHTITSNPGSINNVGSIKSLPVIKIFGSGDITLEINSIKLYLDGIEEYITVDSVLMDVYKDTDLQNSKMRGDFPVLKAGENEITWTGDVSKIEIVVNPRFL